MAKNTAEKTKKKIGLSTQIFIALLIGALFGVVIHYWIPSSYIKDTVIVEGVLYVVGQGFIRLMQMLVVPLVFCSLICGSMAIGDTKKLGTVGVRTLAFYLATTALAVCVALGVGNLINPGVGLDNPEFSSVCGNHGGNFPYGYDPQHHSGQPDQFSGKRNHASGYRICPDRWCDPCENGRACRDSSELFQSV